MKEEAEMGRGRFAQEDSDGDPVNLGNWESTFHPEGGGFKRWKLLAYLAEWAVLRKPLLLHVLPHRTNIRMGCA